MTCKWLINMVSFHQGPGETVTDREVSERDPCASSSSQA